MDVARAEADGAPCRTRTCDLLVRSQTLYPTELWARTFDFNTPIIAECGVQIQISDL